MKEIEKHPEIVAALMEVHSNIRNGKWTPGDTELLLALTTDQMERRLKASKVLDHVWDTLVASPTQPPIVTELIAYLSRFRSDGEDIE